MQKNILAIDTLPRDIELDLVDLDDLRAAFGGQGDLTDLADVAAVPPPKTVMCPSW